MWIERLRETNTWGDWSVDKDANGKEIVLGEGTFGKVYRAVREEYGITSYSAIKVISVPRDEYEIKMIRLESQNEDAVKQYLKDVVDSCVREIKLMESMKANSNIVSIEDYKVIEKTDTVGWDIFIRMELLTSLDDHIGGRTFKKLTETEVIKLGADILNALELFSQLEKPIIHRDVKPANIFVSPLGFFKLGDFGIARELRKTTGNMSRQAGTYNYMAPEVDRSGYYNATVDIYSLGLILYQLLNNNRLPFLNANGVIMNKDREKALKRRFNGEPLPAPAEASEAMARIILKACAFNPNDRYQHPAEFKRALEDLRFGGAELSSVPISEPAVEFDVLDIKIENATFKGRPPQFEPKPAIAEIVEYTRHDVLPRPSKRMVIVETNSQPRKRRRFPLIAACVAAVILMGAIVLTAMLGLDPDKTSNEQTVVQAAADSPRTADFSVKPVVDDNPHVPEYSAKQTAKEEIVSQESVAAEEHKKAYLGVTGYDASEGVYIATVVEGTGADKAGLKSGDIITGVNDERIYTSDQLSDKISNMNAGDAAEMNIIRGQDKNMKFIAMLQ